MKRILILLVALFCISYLYAQYPGVPQTIGNDSNVVKARGGLQGRVINIVYADTASANLERIRQYPGAMIYTQEGTGSLWVRNETATGWQLLASSGATVNIYNSDGTISDAVRTVTISGTNELTFKRSGVDQLFIRSTVAGISSPDNSNRLLLYNDSTVLEGLGYSTDTAYKVLKVNPNTGRLYYADGSSGGGTPAGNYGNVQLNRNGAFATPASDSLTYNGGEFRINIADQGAYSLQVQGNTIVKGSYPTQRMDADGGTYGSFQIDDAAGTISYITGDVGMSIYGSTTYKQINLYSSTSEAGTPLLKLWNNGGIKNSFFDGRVVGNTMTGGASDGGLHWEGQIGDSTSSATDNNGHLIRGIVKYYANAGSAASIYSSVHMGNTTAGNTMGHGVSFQHDFKKTGANTLDIAYGAAFLQDSIIAGRINHRYGVKFWDAWKNGGATLGENIFLRVNKLAAGGADSNYWVWSDSADFRMDAGKIMFGTSSRVRQFNAAGTLRWTGLGYVPLDTSSYYLLVQNKSNGDVFQTSWQAGGGATPDTFVIKIDSTFSAIARKRSEDSLDIASLRIRLNGVTSTPTVTDSTVSWDLGVALNNIYTADGNIGENRVAAIAAASSIRWDLADATSFFMIRTGSDTTLYGSGADFRLPSITSGATTDSVMVYNASTGRVHFRNKTAFATAPAGSDREIQWNDAGAFGASSNFKYNASGELLVGMADAGSFIAQFAGDVTMASSYPILYMNAAPGTYGSLRMEDAAGNINQLYADGGIVYSIPSSAYIHTFMVNSAIVAQFSNTGVPTAGFPGRVSVSGTQSEGASRGIVQIERTLSSLGANHRGYRDGTIFQQDAVAQYAYAAFDADVTMRVLNTRTADHIASHQARGTKDSAGTVTTWYDFVAAVSTVSAGTVTTKYGLYIYPVDTTGTGVVTNQIGIYVPDLTQSTNKVGAIIVNNVMIGSTSSPTAKLDVLSTTEQLRLIYDGSNYASFTVSSAGLLTINNTGSGSALTVTDGIKDTRIVPRVGTTASSATPTPDGDANDQFTVTALATNATFGAPTGTPTDGQVLVIRIKDNGTSRTLAWNAIYRESTDFALPTATTISKTMYLTFVYNSADSKWDCTGFTNGF